MPRFRLTIRRTAAQEAHVEVEAESQSAAIQLFGLRDPGYLPWQQDLFEQPAVVNVEEID